MSTLIQPAEEEELLAQAKRARDGDLRAFEGLVQLYQKRVVANCRHMTRDANVAEDLAQEVFVKAFFGIRHFEGRSSFRHWLQRIKINHCLTHIKKRASAGEHIDIEDPGVQSAEELQVAPQAQRLAEQGSDREAIREVLDTMADTLRIPLVLRDMDGFSYEEVAESLGISLSATKMRIKRARAEFRTRYEALLDTQAGVRMAS
jgi:RNA polymerase sigma-70 factor (ECF subfamily)